MNAPVHAKAYNLPLRSRLLDWLETTPQQTATARQWLGMLNNLQSVRSEEKELSGLAGGLRKVNGSDPGKILPGRIC